MIGRTPYTLHVAGHVQAALALLPLEDQIADWGRALAELFERGGRLLVAGNGGSAAQAQHLTGELVGRFQSERRPLPAIALHADTSTLTAIANDYGWDQAYARAVAGLGRPGDVVLTLSTSGRSRNLLHAAEAARVAGMRAWALTGPAPNPLVGLAEDSIAISAGTAIVQEAHLLVVHLLCTAIDTQLTPAPALSPAAPATAKRRARTEDRQPVGAAALDRREGKPWR
jgi:phosphoheptose isomerase